MMARRSIRNKTKRRTSGRLATAWLSVSMGTGIATTFEMQRGRSVVAPVRASRSRWMVVGLVLSLEPRLSTENEDVSINRNKLTCEPLPQKQKRKCPTLQERGIKSNATWNLAPNFKHVTEVRKADAFLRKRVNDGDWQAQFLLGQLYFEEGCYETALEEFNKIKDTDFQALYQLGVMYYDGLGTKEDPALGVEYMNRIVNSDDLKASLLKFAAYYNLGIASFEGFGIQQSDSKAERQWLLAADDGNPKASVKAQTTLGMFYCRPESQNLPKAFFWHSEACGNGSLESQGALGLLYLTGLGIRKDIQSACECLKEASSRGNVYAQGHLAAFLYGRKLYTSAAELAYRVAQYDNIPLIAKETDCLPSYIAKGIAMAAFYYGRCLQLGLGTKQDQIEARKYFCRAINMDRDIATDLHFQVIMERI